MAEGSVAIFDVLASLFGGIFGSGSSPASLPTWVSSDLIDLAFSQAEFVSALDGAWSWLKKVLDDLRWVWIVPWIEKLQQILDDIITWLQNFLDPLISILTKILDFYRKWIYPIIQDVLEVLQRMRVILSVLVQLHVKWAAKLDADLARIQAYVTTAIQDVIGPLNQAITWLNIALDPGQIIRKDFFTGTLFSSLGAVKGAQAFGQSRALYASEQVAEDNRKALLTPGPAVLTHNADGSVTFSQESQNINAAFGAAVNYYGFPTGTP